MAHRGRETADDQLAIALASGKSIRDSAAAAGVSERTAHRRSADYKFQRRVMELRAGMVSAASGRLVDGMAAAATTLLDLLTHANASIRFKAAAKVLELGVRVREATELEAEVERLRESMEQKFHSGEEGNDEPAR